jgi:hypothetical protein
MKLDKTAPGSLHEVLCDCQQMALSQILQEFQVNVTCDCQ